MDFAWGGGNSGRAGTLSNLSELVGNLLDVQAYPVDRCVPPSAVCAFVDAARACLAVPPRHPDLPRAAFMVLAMMARGRFVSLHPVRRRLPACVKYTPKSCFAHRENAPALYLFLL